MEPNYHHYYDKLYADKDYCGEVDVVLDQMHRITGCAPARVLDVGCGSGRHARVMAQRGCAVVGIDIDPGAIDVAIARCAHPHEMLPQFQVVPIEDLDDDGFDAAVSLFHVVNYIDTSAALQSFFSAIAQRVKPASPFVFDCWNGIAALLDPPQVKRREVVIDGEKISVCTTPTLDRFNQSVAVHNVVDVTDADGQARTFEFDYTSTLWTPRQLTALLDEAGFTVDTISKSFDPTVPADETTWKIMFTCYRRQSG